MTKAKFVGFKLDKKLHQDVKIFCIRAGIRMQAFIELALRELLAKKRSK